MNQVMHIFSGLMKHVVVCLALWHCTLGVWYEKIKRIILIIRDNCRTYSFISLKKKHKKSVIDTKNLTWVESNKTDEDNTKTISLAHTLTFREKIKVHYYTAAPCHLGQRQRQCKSGFHPIRKRKQQRHNGLWSWRTRRGEC